MGVCRLTVSSADAGDHELRRIRCATEGGTHLLPPAEWSGVTSHHCIEVRQDSRDALALLSLQLPFGLLILKALLLFFIYRS